MILLASLSFSQELIAPDAPGLMWLIYVGVEQQQKGNHWLELRMQRENKAEPRGGCSGGASGVWGVLLLPGVSPELLRAWTLNYCFNLECPGGNVP